MLLDKQESSPPLRPHRRGKLLLFLIEKKRGGNGRLATSFEAYFQAGSGFVRQVEDPKRDRRAYSALGKKGSAFSTLEMNSFKALGKSTF